ncbi:phage holin family protein [Candidatus Saccharibacteria bacterium]|nr:phage holin family protein [Candidatus Saccharibacteria bacterium]
MKFFLNVVINGLILGCVSDLFPEIVRIDSIEILITVAFLLTIITTIIQLLCVFIMIIVAPGNRAILLAIGIVIVLFSGIIAMSILNALEGFEVIGFWPKILLSFLVSLNSTNNV